MLWKHRRKSKIKFCLWVSSLVAPQFIPVKKHWVQPPCLADWGKRGQNSATLAQGH